MQNDLSPIDKGKRHAAGALLGALRSLPEQGFSEKALRDTWLEALRADPSFMPGGWYEPPPHGIITLFGKKADGYERINQPSFRPDYMWPRDDIRYERGDVVMLYASPVDKASRLMGDFGLTFYNGDDPAVWAHFESVLKLTLDIAAYAGPGMRLREINAYAMERVARAGLSNDIGSPTDPTGTNIGHTVPLSYEGDTCFARIRALEASDDLNEALRTSRKFLNAQDGFVLPDTAAFTIEPRLRAAGLPVAWFHLIVVFEAGKKTIIHRFDEVFRLMRAERLARLLLP